MAYCRRGVICVLACAVLGLAMAGPARAQDAAEAETHTVKRGDTLYSLARRYGLTVERLQRLNDLDGTTIRIGQELIVAPPDVTPPDTAAPAAEAPPEEPPAPPEEAPRDTAEAAPPPEPEVAPEPETTEARPDTSAPAPPPVDTAAAPLPEAQPPEPTPDAASSAEGERAPPVYGSHTIAEGSGATLYAIAYRYGTTADTLLALNPNLSTFLNAGQTLRLPPSLAAPTHLVKEGETIYDVAARYGVSVRALQGANALEEREVTPGQRLRIPGRRAPQPEPRAALPPVAARGPVQVYPEAFAGRLMAGGAPYDPEKLTVSHPDLPFGTVVLIENPATGQQTLAAVADRGPLDEAFLMDVSAAVARRLGLDAERSDETAVALHVMR